MSAEFITPDWPAPASVRAYVTTRAGGCSKGVYESFNLATHTGDDPAAVARNRELLRERLDLPAEPHWLKQVHGRTTVRIDDASPPREADAAVCFSRGPVCAVLTADCLPVFFCDASASRVGVAHAGWRGLAAGVLESAVAALDCDAGELLAWLGPAIGPHAFRVGDDVRDAFDADEAAAFLPDGMGRWMADIFQLARMRLKRLGVGQVWGGAFCTYKDPRFYSHRRDGGHDGAGGRMASLIGLSP